jgi:predicted 3-demethylubiquinone-9 3-methyltransferase (glyoxalase superfamily)
MISKNTICLWFDKEAEEAARFYAATFPDSEVKNVFYAPMRFILLMEQFLKKRRIFLLFAKLGLIQYV